MRRIAPPLPAASQPSKTRIVEIPLCVRLSLQQVEASLLPLQSDGRSPADPDARSMSSRSRTLKSRSIRSRVVAGRRDARVAVRPRRPACSFAGARERFPDGVAQHRSDDHAPVALVLAFDDVPGGLVGAGPSNRAIGGGHEAVEHPPVPPRVLADAPPAERILFERLESPLLRRLPEVHPELQNHRAVVGERALERGDLVEQRIELRHCRCGARRDARIGDEYHALRNSARRPLGGRSRQ